MTRIDWKALFVAAARARALAHAPYSKFRVGAAVLTRDGAIITGCNVENATYGLTVCAERNALARVVVEGRKPVAIAIVAGGKRAASPCGACRQVMIELCGEEAPVRSRTPGGKERRFTVGGLLPDAFTADDL